MTIQTFRKKPVTIQALQYTGDNLAEVLAFTGKHPKWHDYFTSFEHYEEFVKNDDMIFKIKTLQGTMKAVPGDWIIRGVNDEFYPIKSEIFAQTYEEVSDV